MKQLVSLISVRISELCKLILLNVDVTDVLVRFYNYNQKIIDVESLLRETWLVVTHPPWWMDY